MYFIEFKHKSIISAKEIVMLRELTEPILVMNINFERVIYTHRSRYDLMKDVTLILNHEFK